MPFALFEGMKTSKNNSEHMGNTERLLIVMLASLLLFATVPVNAAKSALHSHDEIRASVKAYVESHTDTDKDTEIHIGQLDERLRLAKCSIKTEHYLPPGGKMESRFVVGTRCNGNKRWAIYVPVKRIRYGDVVVTTRPLRRGESIAQDHVEVRRTALNNLHSGYILRLDKVLGKTVKTTLKTGTVLHSGNLKAAISVRRGEKVNILANKGPIQVRMTGKALMDGAEGQRIRVKNQLSDRIIEGTVTYDGNVRVGL